MVCSQCGTKNPENSVYCFNCGQKIDIHPNYPNLSRPSLNRGILSEDKDALMRETKPWPRGAEEDAPTSLDLRPAVNRINAQRGPKLLKAAVGRASKDRI